MLYSANARPAGRTVAIRTVANRLCAAGRVFEFVHGTDNAQPLVTQRNVSEIVQALLASLQDEPHIAEKVCYALSQLAAGSKQEDGLSLLSPYFKEIIQALLTTVRPSLCSKSRSWKLPRL